MSQEVKMDKMQLVSAYMDFVLKQGKAPENVYVFAKECGIEESEFYTFFASFEVLEKHVFTAFYDHTIALLHKNEAYHTFQAKDQLLSFYYTFFEILTVNRSFVLYVLQKQTNIRHSISLFSELRKNVKEFMNGLEIEKLELKNKNLNKLQDKKIEELGWGQLIIFINYWKKDTSDGFEKTDVFIEKSVTACFDVMNIKPIKSVMDLGKFLFKENLRR